MNDMNEKKKKGSSADERGLMKKTLAGQTSRVPPCAHANPAQTKKWKRGSQVFQI